MKITQVQGTGIPIRGNDIDTDRIIPARFMKCVTFEGLGEYAFYDARHDSDGNKVSHPMNDDKFKGGSILIVNKNFGCGSSREHAPQALAKYGIRAIIGESFAEIFAGNCVLLGIPTLIASKDEIDQLMETIEESPREAITINVENGNIDCAHLTIEAEMNQSAQFALTQGKWDSTQVLLESKDQIADTASNIPYIEFNK